MYEDIISQIETNLTHLKARGKELEKEEHLYNHRKFGHYMIKTYLGTKILPPSGIRIETKFCQDELNNWELYAERDKAL